MIGIGTHLQKFRGNKSWLSLAALTALLICIGIPVGFFINKTNSPDKASQTRSVQPIPKPNANLTQQPRVLNLPPSEIQNSDVLEDVEPVKTQKVSVKETVEREGEIDRQLVRMETIAKPKSFPAQIEITRPAVVKTPRRKELPSQTRPRVTVSEPVPDIEAIFTGRSSNGRHERVRYEDGRGNSGKISKEEWREIRRERRQNRKQRGNPFPF